MSSSERACLEATLNVREESGLSAIQSESNKTTFEMEMKSCRNSTNFHVLIPNNAADPMKTYPESSSTTSHIIVVVPSLFLHKLWVEMPCRLLSYILRQHQMDIYPLPKFNVKTKIKIKAFI